MRFADAKALLRHYLVSFFLEGWLTALPEAQHEEIFAEVEKIIDRRAIAEGCVRASVRALYVEAQRVERPEPRAGS